MEELKRDLGYWLYLDIDNNDYLNVNAPTHVP